MANFWDDLNNRAVQRASQGATQSWDEYSKALAAQTPQPVKKKKGFWEDQISTGGSLGGALAGGAAGTAILPGVGTLIGALLGGAAGGFGGQVAENKITGEQDLFKDAGTEALWGGATALPFGAGLKLAKAGGTLAKGLGSDAAKTAAKELVQEAGVKTMGRKQLQNLTLKDALAPETKAAAERLALQPSLTQKMGGKLSGAADDLAIKQFRLNPGQLTKYNTKFGEDAGKTIRNYGFTSAEDIAAKGIDPLQTRFTDTVSNIGNVSTDLLKKNFDDIYKKLAGSASSDMQSIGKQFKSESDAILKKYGKTVDANELNTIRREYDSLVNYTQSVANPARHSVNKRVADSLRKALQEADPSGQLKSVGQELSKLRNLSDIVEKQGQLGRGSLPINLPSLLGAAAGGGVGGFAGGIPGMVGGAAVTMAANSPAGRKAMFNLAEKGVAKLSSKGPSVLGQTIPQATARIGGAGGLRAALSDQSSDLNSMGSTTNSTNASSAPTMNDPMTSNMDSQYSEDPQVSSEPSIGGYSKSQIENAMAAAIMDGNSKAYSQLESLYGLLPKDAELSSAAGTQVASNANATNTLSQLEGLYGTSGGGLGKIGGSLQNALAGAGMNGDVQTYNDLAASSVSQLARALNGGGQVSDADAAVVIQALPKVTDSPEVAARKFAALKDRLQNAMQNTLTDSGGASPEPTASVY